MAKLRTQPVKTKKRVAGSAGQTRFRTQPTGTKKRTTGVTKAGNRQTTVRTPSRTTKRTTRRK